MNIADIPNSPEGKKRSTAGYVIHTEIQPDGRLRVCANGDMVFMYNPGEWEDVNFEAFVDDVDRKIDDYLADKLAGEILPQLQHDLAAVPKHMRDKVWYYNNQRSLLDEDGWEMPIIRGEGHAL